MSRPSVEQMETVIIARIAARMPDGLDMSGPVAMAIMKGAGDAAEAIGDMLD